jgi:hypothetical protein
VILYLGTTKTELEKMRRTGYLRSLNCGCRAGVELLTAPPASAEVLLQVEYEHAPGLDDMGRDPERVRVFRAVPIRTASIVGTP